MDYAKLFSKGDLVGGVDFNVKLRQAIGYLDHEVLLGIYIDADNKLVDLVQEGTGDSNSVTAPHEQFIARAKKLGVSKFLIAHNHPGEHYTPTPSGVIYDLFVVPAGDIGFTLGLLHETAGTGVTLLDHLVVGCNAVTSIRQVVHKLGATPSYRLNRFAGVA